MLSKAVSKTLATVIIAVVVIAVVGGVVAYWYYSQQKPAKLVYVVIGKSVHPYWSVVEAGVKKAGQELGVEVIFWVPTKEDVAAQLSTMDSYIAQKVAGIAIAPSDPGAATKSMILVLT
jgi:ABC-type sugar transport system substrate-binding protein